MSRQTIIADSDGGSERWQEGETFVVQKNYALCRCGHSRNKPFCDGTHSKIGFDGTETASREPYSEQANVIDGPMVSLSDAESLCAFGRFCDTHGGVWNLVARTDEPTIRATVLRQAENCPAGRLVAWDKATGKPVEHHLPLSIGLVEDPEGWLWVNELHGGRIAAYHLREQRWREIPLPSASAMPVGLARHPDGSMWASLFRTNRIARIDPKSERVKE